MSNETQAPAPDIAEAPGWVVLDPDGNIVDSGPVTEAMAVAVTDEGGE